MKRIQSIPLILLLFIIMSCAPKQKDQPNKMEPQNEMITLFDGTSTEHWRGYNAGQFPDSGWVVKDSALTIIPGEGGGDIITKNKYCNFVLTLQWKVAKGSNGGIFYRALEQPEEAIYWSAPEMQVLDNENHPDAKMGIDGNHKAGSLYDLIPAKPQNTKPFGEWNSVKIVADGAHIEHWQNGVKVLEYELWTPEWYKMLRNSKFIDHPAFGDMRCGYIGLQDHGDEVSFKNIRVKVLN